MGTNIGLEVGNNIAKYRKQRGLTQKEFAKKLGIKHTNISNWEKNVSNMDIEMLLKISKVLEVKVSDLYGIETSGNKKTLEANSLEELLQEFKEYVYSDKELKNKLLIEDSQKDAFFKFLKDNKDTLKKIMS